MSKEMVVSANPHETRVAILEEGQLCEIYVEREKEFALVGSIYKGRVTRVLPGMQSAFVDIGLDSDAFLYVSDFLQEIEDMDHGAETHAPNSPRSSHEEFSQAAPSAVTVLPGETIGSLSGHSADAGALDDSHGNYSNRPFQREGRRDQGDFRRADGRRRDRGRAGRGRPGRGGRDRSYGHQGRELPQSKYASHRPYEPPEEEVSSQPFEPVILPGESLSVTQHHDLAESSAAESQAHSHSEPLEATDHLNPSEEAHTQESVAAPEESAESNLAHSSAASQSLAESSAADQQADASEGRGAPTESHAEPFYPSTFSRGGRSYDRGRARGGRNFSRDRGSARHGNLHRDSNDRREPLSWVTSLEPLPGESLAKAKVQEQSSTAAREEVASGSSSEPLPPESSSLVNFLKDAPQSERFAPDVFEQSASDAVEEHHAPELTEEEATNLAEQLAEAQQEEAERDAVERASASGSLSLDFSNGDGQDAMEEEDEESDSGENDLSTAHEFEPPSHLSDENQPGSELFSQGGEHMPLPGMSETESEAIEETDGEEIVQEELAASAAEDEPQFRPTEARIRSDFRARLQRPVRRGGRDRSRRPFHRHMRHRGQPRRNQLISELLKAGQEIIVQIAKEPLGKKGARITSHIALPGRFLVYMPTLDHTGVSRKIASAEERSRLRHLVTDAKGSASGGFIVRTAAASASPDEVRADVQFLTKTWMDIKGHSEERKSPSLLHRDLNLVERILRDYLSPDYTSIWVDSEEEYTKILEFVSRFQPQLANRVKLFTKPTPIFEEFGIQQEIDKGLRPKVWLKSGGYIVINHTEALVAIDVNTGKFVGRGSTRLEDTIVRTNIEAVKEIVRQIRLRDLGGIIIIDFIDMEERRNREKVMSALEEALKADRAPSKVLRFNEFGLVAITRKRTKQALERTLCQPCPYCTGSGMVKSIPTLCYEIQTEACKMAPEIEAASITLRVHPEIAKALKTRESSLMDELEQAIHKSLIIQADPTLHWEQYDIY